MITPQFEEKRKETQFKPGVSGNLAGKPKGTKHITTIIQQLLDDDKFKTMILEGYELKEYQGKPINAILGAQIRLALNSKDENVRIKATDLLLKHGWNQKLETDITSGGEKIDFNATQADQLIRARAVREQTDI